MASNRLGRRDPRIQRLRTNPDKQVRLIATASEEMRPDSEPYRNHKNPQL